MTSTAGRERQVTWAPDSRRLVYVSDRDGSQGLYLYDFSTSQETRLTQAPAGDVTPIFSPDGKSIVVPARRHASCAWSTSIRSAIGCSRERSSIACRSPPTARSRGRRTVGGSRTSIRAGKGFSNVYVIPSCGWRAPAGDVPRERVRRIDLVEPGRHVPHLRFVQRTEERQLARIDLVLRTPRFREDQFRDLFRVETRNPAQPSPATPPHADADARRRRLPIRPSGQPRPTAMPRGLTRDVVDGAGADRLRRHPPPAVAAGRRRVCRHARDQPRRQVACCSSPARVASRTCTSTRSMSSRAIRRSRGRSRPRPAPSATRSGRRTARRSSTSSRDASTA